MERRSFIKWSVFVYLSLAVYLTDILSKIFEYLIGPSFSDEDKKRILLSKINIFEKKIQLEKLKYERMVNEKLFIANVEDLNGFKAINFIDFQLRPGIAYLDSKGEVKVTSAVCTHLGCSVRSQIEGGKILCPCHNALFDADTGNNVGGPETEPLKEIKHILEDGKLFITT